MAVGFSPVVPELCSRIYSQLGYSEEDFRTVTWVCLFSAAIHCFLWNDVETQDKFHLKSHDSYGLSMHFQLSRLEERSLQRCIPSVHLHDASWSFDLYVCMQENTQWGGLKAGQVMADAQPIFRRIEEPIAEGASAPQKPSDKKEKKKSKQKVAVAPTNMSA